MFDAVIDEIHEREIRIGDSWFVDFASCNYLGFDLDQEIISRIDGWIRRWGTHPSWSRLLGNPRLYPEIEDRLTDLLGAPDTLVLPTITHIHMSVIPALASGGHIFLERLAHKTIYDGCRYARGLGATVSRFTDGDLGELADLLRAAPAGPRLVCLDGVNSMTGNLPKLSDYARLCRQYDATLYVDDAHGFGVIGERSETEASPYGCRGNSCVRYFGESYDNIVLVGGFSKAYSSLLAFIALPTKLKNHLKVAAPPYLYSGPSPVASLAGVLAGFDVNEDRGDALRARLYRLTARLLDRIRRCGLVVRNVTGTPILELPMAAGRDLRTITRTLWQSGIYVTVAAYPLVPREDVGFRVQLTARHTEPQVDHLATVIEGLAGAGLLRRAADPGPPALAPSPDL
jgi:8-amino-7-oxononanoate synthase